MFLWRHINGTSTVARHVLRAVDGTPTVARHVLRAVDGTPTVAHHIDVVKCYYPVKSSRLQQIRCRLILHKTYNVPRSTTVISCLFPLFDHRIRQREEFFLNQQIR